MKPFNLKLIKTLWGPPIKPLAFSLEGCTNVSWYLINMDKFNCMQIFETILKPARGPAAAIGYWT